MLVLSLTSTLPMTEAEGATNAEAEMSGRWSNRFITARCLENFSWKSQLSCARQPMRSIAWPVSRRPRPIPTTARRSMGRKCPPPAAIARATRVSRPHACAQPGGRSRCGAAAYLASPPPPQVLPRGRHSRCAHAAPTLFGGRYDGVVLRQGVLRRGLGREAAGHAVAGQPSRGVRQAVEGSRARPRGCRRRAHPRCRGGARVRAGHSCQLGARFRGATRVTSGGAFGCARCSSNSRTSALSAGTRAPCAARGHPVTNAGAARAARVVRAAKAV